MLSCTQDRKELKQIGPIMNVLLIEDDFATAKSLTLSLRKHNMVCSHASTGQQGVEYALNQSYDIIVLDMMLPDISGMEVIDKLRYKKSTTPILVLSAIDNTEHKISALRSGADDYLTKPYSSWELVARIRAIVKRTNDELDDHILQAGKIGIDTSNRILTVNDQPLKLTQKEYDLMELLIQHRGHFVTKEQVVEYLYKHQDQDAHASINVFVCRLRNKLKKASNGLNFIQTSWGLGYRLEENGEEAKGREDLFDSQRKLLEAT